MELVPDSALLGRVVMVVWHSGTPPEVLQPAVERLRGRVGERGRVTIENSDRLETVPHEGSSVDVVLSGLLPPHSFTHSPSLLAELARVLRPSGLLYLREPVTTSGEVEGVRPVKKLSSALRLSGFVDLSEVEVAAGESGLRADLEPRGSTLAGSDTVSLALVTAKKPSYEVGASSNLSFANNRLPNPPHTKVSEETVRVWSLDPTDDDLDLLDSDTLLEEEDLVKPDLASLKSTTCGPKSDRKKACKDCTCGLREELDGGKPTSGTRTVTSSCGSCYLGDAFRCASCPYLGMPAFKPGEQIRLSNRQLKADQ